MTDLPSLSKAELLQKLSDTLREKDAQIAALAKERDAFQQERDELQLAYNKLLQERFRRRSERYLASPDQMRLDFGDTPEAADAASGLADAVEDLQQTIPTHQRRKPKKKRDESLPAHLHRYEVVADGPELFFADYRGTLLGDCWNGFDSIAVASQGAILRAACNAHARRKIFDSTSYPAERHRWLIWYGQLYDIEARGRLLSPDARLALRQREAQPIWNAMQTWLGEVSQRTASVILPKSDFGKALQYVRNHLVELPWAAKTGSSPAVSSAANGPPAF